MKAISKVDVINKYREPRKMERPMTAAERKEYRRIHTKATEEDFFVVEKSPYYLAKVGDELRIITENPGAWKIVVSVENKAGDKFFVNWDDLKTD